MVYQNIQTNIPMLRKISDDKLNVKLESSYQSIGYELN